MLLGIYGLSAKAPTLRQMWPEQELEGSDLAAVNYKYADATDVGCQVDHVTCHADGRFHIKTKNDKDVYVQKMQRTEPLGPDTSTFLEVIIISDLATKYPVVAGNVKYPHIWFGLPEDHHIALRGMFAGVNSNVEQTMAATMAQFSGQHGGTVLTSGTLKGCILGQPKKLSGDPLANRPRGTLVSFKFPVADDKWHIKAFLFE